MRVIFGQINGTSVSTASSVYPQPLLVIVIRSFTLSVKSANVFVCGKTSMPTGDFFRTAIKNSSIAALTLASLPFLAPFTTS